MLKKNFISFSNLLLSLSDAVDMVSNDLAQHQMRTAFVAWQVAEEMKLPPKMIKNIFMAALLHDIGALTSEEKVRIHRFEETKYENHCQRGAALFEKNTLLSDLSPIILNHHRALGDIDGKIDTPGILESQIVCLADHLERYIVRDHFILHQVNDLHSKLTDLSNSIIHDDVIQAFMKTSDREEFWLDLTSPRLYSLLLRHGPLMSKELSLDELELIAKVFLQVIDFRSRFTSTHTAGVTECAQKLAECFGFSTSEVQELRIAGMFHDLGKLAVPNSILEKPGKLTTQEFAVMRKHTYFTYMVLSSVTGMEKIAEWGAFHHEKLNGSGYPFRARESEISTGSRIVAVADIFTAMAEDRPYRSGMKWNEINQIMLNLVKDGLLDKKVVTLLFDNYDEILKSVMTEQNTSRDSYESFTEADRNL